MNVEPLKLELVMPPLKLFSRNPTSGRSKTWLVPKYKPPLEWHEKFDDTEPAQCRPVTVSGKIEEHHDGTANKNPPATNTNLDNDHDSRNIFLITCAFMRGDLLMSLGGTGQKRAFAVML